MTNETKPVLLTEADVRRLHDKPYNAVDEVIDELRERGLIAPEPVKTVDDIVRNELVRAYTEAGQPSTARAIAKGDYDTSPTSVAAKRLYEMGMELAKPELTREMVRAAVERHASMQATVDYAALHAALTEGQSK